jgi:anti-sigma-K factor RskA
MTTLNAKTRERHDIEQLLPWHAAGALSPQEAGRVQAALAHDDDLVREFAAVREEFVATIHLNETLDVPSLRLMQRLRAGIEAEGAASKERRRSYNIESWLAARLSRLSARTLAWSAVAATLAIALEAAATIHIVQRGGSGDHRIVTYSRAGDPASGTFALVRFAPSASAAEIASFLGAHKISIVDGPREEGIYKVRAAGLPKEEFAQTLSRMRKESTVVRLIVPTE